MTLLLRSSQNFCGTTTGALVSKSKSLSFSLSLLTGLKTGLSLSPHFSPDFSSRYVTVNCKKGSMLMEFRTWKSWECKTPWNCILPDFVFTHLTFLRAPVGQNARRQARGHTMSNERQGSDNVGVAWLTGDNGWRYKTFLMSAEFIWVRHMHVAIKLAQRHVLY